MLSTLPLTPPTAPAGRLWELTCAEPAVLYISAGSRVLHRGDRRAAPPSLPRPYDVERPGKGNPRNLVVWMQNAVHGFRSSRVQALDDHPFRPGADLAHRHSDGLPVPSFKPVTHLQIVVEDNEVPLQLLVTRENLDRFLAAPGHPDRRRTEGGMERLADRPDLRGIGVDYQHSHRFRKEFRRLLPEWTAQRSVSFPRSSRAAGATWPSERI